MDCFRIKVPKHEEFKIIELVKKIGEKYTEYEKRANVSNILKM